MSRDLAQEVLSHSFACGWREKEGTVRLAWGAQAQAPGASLSLQFRDFFYPHAKTDDGWAGFPASGICAPAHHQMRDAFPAAQFPPHSLGKAEELPTADAWRAFCEQIETEFRSGSVKKVVPVRSRSFALDTASHGRVTRELLPRLFSGPANGTYRFFLKWNDHFFFGATPELLFRREEEEIFVPAIAGTRALTGARADDEALGRELLANEKERHEHQLVVEGISSTLRSLGLAPKFSSTPELLFLRGLVHLHTPLRALHRGVPSPALVEALHPTPAVGGTPQKDSAEFLRKHEPLARGLFASPLLFRGLGQELCFVAIRSALLTPSELRLYAGAGYVPGSRPEAEWEETGKKMDTLARLLEEERR